MSNNLIINIVAASLSLGAIGVALFVGGCSRPAAEEASSAGGTALDTRSAVPAEKVAVVATPTGDALTILTREPAPALVGTPTATPTASSVYTAIGARPSGSKPQPGSAGFDDRTNPFALSAPTGGSYVRIGSYGGSAVATMRSTPNGGSYVRIGSFGGSTVRTAPTVSYGGSYVSVGSYGGTAVRFGSNGGTARRYDPYGGAARAFAGGFAGSSRPLNQQLDDLEQRAEAAERRLNELIEAIKKQ